MKTSDNEFAIRLKCVFFAAYGTALLLADAFEAALLSHPRKLSSLWRARRGD